VRSPCALEVLQMVPIPVFRAVVTFLGRYRAALVITLVIGLASSGTAAAVSYVLLGGTSHAATTTTIKSGVNGPVLQLTNTNTSNGPSARGLSITVPAGRAPMTVNSSAKVTNLNADKLDGLDASALARGVGVAVLSNRRVLANGDTNVLLLTLPGLGVLRGYCPSGDGSATIYWVNTTSASIDEWDGWVTTATLEARIAGPGNGLYPVAGWGGSNQQRGDTLLLGRGNDPGARRTATVTLGAYRSVVSAPCGLQATATIWSTP
jgi:hypothetical protein